MTHKNRVRFQDRETNMLPLLIRQTCSVAIGPKEEDLGTKQKTQESMVEAVNISIIWCGKDFTFMADHIYRGI